MNLPLQRDTSTQRARFVTEQNSVADRSRGLHLVSPDRAASPKTAARASHGYSPLALWHLLSLDAPSVAALWLVFIARCAGVTLRWTSPAAMFVAVWMLYVADRLLDARPLASGEVPPGLEERHRFHHRHRRAFLAAFVLASAFLAALLHTLSAATLHLYIVLAALLTSWLLLVHARAIPSAHRLPKELAVGVFFPAAVFIPTVARVPFLRPELLPPAIAFAAACALNCLLLFAWEHPRDRSAAHWSTRWASRYLWLLGGGTTLASFAMGLLYEHLPSLSALAPVAFACALSAALLLLLDRTRGHLSRLHARALADAALLTPLFFAILWRGLR